MPQIKGWKKKNRYLWVHYEKGLAGKIKKRGYKDWVVAIVDSHTGIVVWHNTAEKYTEAENMLIRKMKQISARLYRRRR